MDIRSGNRLDVLIVGAGFAGLYMLHRARGLGFTAGILEAGGDVGGTWYWNRYPGARCDIESLEYSYQFSDELQQDWVWTERYASQPEILRYINHVADRFDLRRDIAFDTRVISASFDEPAGMWAVETGDGRRVAATFLVLATGCLSTTNTPEFDGGDRFAGARYHTGSWPHQPVDFAGKRVGVIGTGSSAIQSIPIIAGQAAHLYVFQRTPNWTIPAHNAPLDPIVQGAVKADYAALRSRAKRNRAGIDFVTNESPALQASPEERRREYDVRWARGGIPFIGAFADLLLDKAANDTAAQYVRSKIREAVRDPEVAARLTPTNAIGCKRLCVDTGYWETFNRRNVALVDIAETPIEALTPNGIKVNGREYGVEAIVFATGFDAMTGTLLRIDIRGRAGVRLGDKWRDGPSAYLGLAISGFPNLFIITGPGSPSVLTNMLPSIEQHVDWIADCIVYMRAHALGLVEAAPEAEDSWQEHSAAVAGKSLRATCSSWYIGANIAGKPRVFMPYIGGFPGYVQKCNEVAEGGYEGFSLS